jgi:hypothetical protein
MNIEPFDGATCAASDLTARLVAELARAKRELARAEEELFAATMQSRAERRAIPFQLRRQRSRCRNQIDMLRLVLAGMPYSEGEYHVESA